MLPSHSAGLVKVTEGICADGLTDNVLRGPEWRAMFSTKDRSLGKPGSLEETKKERQDSDRGYREGRYAKVSGHG